MKTYKHLYEKICSYENLFLAYKRARKGKTKKRYIIVFEANLRKNLLELQEELINNSYYPKPLKTFILRDPKTRKISKAEFRDRIVHHAICNIIEPFFDKIFIHDSCANRLGRGNLFGLRRFDLFKRKICENGNIIKNKFNDKNYVKGYCLKADIKHYFQEVCHNILVRTIYKKIRDNKLISLIKKILENGKVKEGIGMPLGNLTSQFFANIYLNELDYFVKHELKAKYYIRYVDDFVILHESKIQLEIFKIRISRFLKEALKLELHIQKSRILCLSQGIDFVGFRNFYYHRLLRKRNIKNMAHKIKLFKKGKLSYEKILESFQGWNAYAKWANSFTLSKEFTKKLILKNI